ncbi:MAG: hypothetical protein PHY47_14900 [Lachnospiraceae bacterium]|nr:hypothetical protein [Lachnospiraceae bacterium]
MGLKNQALVINGVLTSPKVVQEADALKRKKKTQKGQYLQL